MTKKLLSILIIASFLFLTSFAWAQMGTISRKDCRIALSKVSATGQNSEEILHNAYLALWQLVLTGTEEDVDLIAPFLNCDQLGYYARTALINIPGPKSRQALRAALDTAKGNALIGVIQSLADSNDKESVAKIIALSKTDQIAFNAAALNALAKLGGQAAEDQIRTALKSDQKKIRDNAVDALLYFVQRALVDFDHKESKKDHKESKMSKNDYLKEVEETWNSVWRLNVVADQKKAEELLSILKKSDLSSAKKILVDRAENRLKGQSYPMSPRPTDHNIAGSADQFKDLLTRSIAASGSEKEKLAMTTLNWARDSRPGSGYEKTLADALRSAKSNEEKNFYRDLLVQVGTKEALRTIASTLDGSNDNDADHVTRILGEWISMDAEPYLMALAKSYPQAKYRTRAFRGYARLVRQMLDQTTPKLAMIEKILPVAASPADKKIFTDLTAHLEKTRRDVSIFDGKTFNGWEGKKEIFRIENGMVIGGFTDKPVPQNEFLCTTQRYRDFTLTLECRIEGKGANAGVQFRSERIANHHEMIGFQADMTEDGSYWGALYDESRRNKFLGRPDPELIKKIYKPGDWNEYKIVCWGSRIKIFLNGVLTVDYIEKDPSIPLEGVIGLQIHKGGPSRSFYRNIRLEAYQTRMFQ